VVQLRFESGKSAQTRRSCKKRKNLTLSDHDTPTNKTQLRLNKIQSVYILRVGAEGSNLLKEDGPMH